MPFTVGMRLAHYEIVRLIGVGGMGEVYQAHDTTLDRDVALKVLHEKVTSDVDQLARLEREAKLLAALNHPGIASVHSLERIGGLQLLVMEFVPGMTLAERLGAGALGLQEALRIAREIAVAVEAAHAKGIIHRDLKPANIKIAPGGRVKLLDFGLAKVLDPAEPRLSISPTIVSGAAGGGLLQGTVAYMSPEQARGLTVDTQTDIWALGCVLFEMLTGRQTFSGATATDILAFVITREPDWRILPAAASSSVRSLLRQCLQKDLANRLHDIADVRINLDEALSGEPALAPEQRQRDGRLKRALPWLVSGGLGLAGTRPAGDVPKCFIGRSDGESRGSEPASGRRTGTRLVARESPSRPMVCVSRSSRSAMARARFICDSSIGSMPVPFLALKRSYTRCSRPMGDRSPSPRRTGC